VSSPDRRYPDRPIVGVGAVIFVDPVSPVIGLPSSLPQPCGVVLVKRRFEPLAGQWSLPGGMLEVGETLEAGVAREMLEETGLVVAVGAVIEVFDRIMLDDSQRVRHHYVLVDYLCTPVGGSLQAASDASAVAIADPRALAAYAVTAKVEEVVSRALEMRER
jgi:8-oxo-dGTP diphosphatase